MAFAFPYSIDWFPGWTQFEHYNRQPNDDGLSDQDCVEIRRHYQYPPATTLTMDRASSSSSSKKTGSSPVPGNTSPKLLNSFMWNDRDCNAKNYFICERPMDSGDDDDEEDAEDADDVGRIDDRANQNSAMTRNQGK